MPGFRVTAEGPTGQAARGAPSLGSALLPVPARVGQGYQSWGRVIGSPGVTPIPAPAPIAGIDREYTAEAIQGVGPGGMGRPSSDYNCWYPSYYYQPELPSRFHGAISSDNQMPCPAILPSANGRFGFEATGNHSVFKAARKQKRLGDRQVSWPITLPQYKNWTAK